jgi:hypothetical protein
MNLYTIKKEYELESKSGDEMKEISFDKDDLVIVVAVIVVVLIVAGVGWMFLSH